MNTFCNLYLVDFLITIPFVHSILYTNHKQLNLQKCPTNLLLSWVSFSSWKVGNFGRLRICSLRNPDDVENILLCRSSWRAPRGMLLAAPSVTSWLPIPRLRIFWAMEFKLSPVLRIFILSSSASCRLYVVSPALNGQGQKNDYITHNYNFLLLLWDWKKTNISNLDISSAEWTHNLLNLVIISWSNEYKYDPDDVTVLS